MKTKTPKVYHYRESHVEGLTPNRREMVLLRGKQKAVRSLIRVLLLIPVLLILTVLKCYQLYTIWEMWENYTQQQYQSDHGAGLTVAETSDKIEFVSRYTITKSRISDLDFQTVRRQVNFLRRKNTHCHNPEPVCGC